MSCPSISPFCAARSAAFRHTKRHGEEYAVWDRLFWVDNPICLYRYQVTCFLPIQPHCFLEPDRLRVCLRFNETGLAQFEHDIANPNVSNAHLIANMWQQDVQVRVVYDLIRPDGSKIKLKDLDNFAHGCLFMTLGTVDCPDAYVTMDKDDILEHCSDDTPIWVEGVTWSKHGSPSGDFALQWVTHEDGRGREFMQVTHIATPYNGDYDSEKEFFSAIHGTHFEIEDGGRSVVVLAPPQTHKRKRGQATLHGCLRREIVYLSLSQLLQAAT